MAAVVGWGGIQSRAPICNRRLHRLKTDARLKKPPHTLPRPILFLFVFALAASAQQKIPVNYDESKVGTYTLPDPLVLNNGQPVRDRNTWYDQRRPEITCSSIFPPMRAARRLCFSR